MRLSKIIIIIAACINLSIAGTIFLSKSFDSSSRYTVKNPWGNYSFKANYDCYGECEPYFGKTYSIGYNHIVWKEKKKKYNVGLGLEYLKNDNFNLKALYIMLNYEPLKKMKASLFFGVDFFNAKDDPSLNNEHDYYPNTKGGGIYGLSFSYNLNKKLPISFDYKVYTFSIVNQDIWRDVEFSRVSLNLGYNL